MRRLIERRLPLLEISTESAREKSIRHGHISTLHIWWARRPLAASRAAVFATLVPDSDENYELVKDIVPWEAVKNGNSDAILRARAKVLAANRRHTAQGARHVCRGWCYPARSVAFGV